MFGREVPPSPWESQVAGWIRDIPEEVKSQDLPPPYKHNATSFTILHSWLTGLPKVILSTPLSPGGPAGASPTFVTICKTEEQLFEPWASPLVVRRVERRKEFFEGTVGGANVAWKVLRTLDLREEEFKFGLKGQRLI